MSTSNERLYYATLRKIAKDYMSSERILRDGEKLYGVSGEEALQMAYDNIQVEAAAAIRGRRPPKAAAGTKEL